MSDETAKLVGDFSEESEEEEEELWNVDREKVKVIHTVLNIFIMHCFKLVNLAHSNAFEFSLNYTKLATLIEQNKFSKKVSSSGD